MYGIVSIKKLLQYTIPCIAVALALWLGGLLVSAVKPAEGVRVPVIMYHAVIADEKRLGQYVISPAELESDFRWLQENGYTPVLSEDLLAYTEEGRALPEKPVMLTFDDGYYNNYLYAFPLAQQYGMKFVLSPIGKCTDLYTETPDGSPYYAHCTWAQLKEMQESGLVEIGNHSYDLHSTEGTLGTKRHAEETMEAYTARLSSDLLLAQEKIRMHLGAEPVLFAYPFGAVSEGEPEILRRMGFRITLSCEEKTSTVTREAESLDALGRYLRPSGESSAAFFRRVLAE